MIKNLLVFFILTISLYGETIFSFPQKIKYYGNVVIDNNYDDSVQNIYEYWLKNYYEESSDGKLARVKWDQLDKTVSEGIGYGMLIMVYMDNEVNNTRPKFNKLWSYYNNFLDDNKLMHWKINNFSNVEGYGSATDAEMDVLLALIMAYKQWKDDSYLRAARELSTKILTYEVNSNNQLVAGNHLQDKMNPSYFSIVAMNLCQQIDIIDNVVERERWGKVVETSYNNIKISRDQNTGYVPDWTNLNNNPTAPYMGYDAIRVPWRVAWSYAWDNDSIAKEICDKISNTIISKGINSFPINRTYMGAFMLSAMTDTSKKIWMNDRLKEIYNLNTYNDIYFGHTLNVLYQLLITGNMPNFYDSKTNIKNKVAKFKNNVDVYFMGYKYGMFQLRFKVYEEGVLNIYFYDLKGRNVYNVIHNKNYTAGEWLLNVINKIPKGNYLVDIKFNNINNTKKILILK